MLTALDLIYSYFINYRTYSFTHINPFWEYFWASDGHIIGFLYTTVLVRGTNKLIIQAFRQISTKFMLNTIMYYSFCDKLKRKGQKRREAKQWLNKISQLLQGYHLMTMPWKFHSQILSSITDSLLSLMWS